MHTAQPMAVSKQRVLEMLMLSDYLFCADGIRILVPLRNFIPPT